MSWPARRVTAEEQSMNTALLDKPGSAEFTAKADLQIVAVHLGGELYGVDIACIHSVLPPQLITAVPNVPRYVVGVMNLRGRILPVLDLRSRFGMPPLDPVKQKGARIVIVEWAGLAAGLVVDSVAEVLRLPKANIEAVSALLASADSRYVAGIGKVGGGRRSSDRREHQERLILLLDIEQTLTLANTEASGRFKPDAR